MALEAQVNALKQNRLSFDDEAEISELEHLIRRLLKRNDVL